MAWLPDFRGAGEETALPMMKVLDVRGRLVSDAAPMVKCLWEKACGQEVGTSQLSQPDDCRGAL
jgi:hypothetical protein